MYCVFAGMCVLSKLKCCHTIIIIVAFHKQMNQLCGVVLMKHVVLLVTNNYKIMVVYYQTKY